jgi:hypothetical protein
VENYNNELKSAMQILGQTNIIKFKTQTLLFTAKTHKTCYSATQACVFQRGSGENSSTTRATALL